MNRNRPSHLDYQMRACESLPGKSREGYLFPDLLDALGVVRSRCDGDGVGTNLGPTALYDMRLRMHQYRRLGGVQLSIV